MKKQARKLLAIVLSMLLLCSIIPLTTFTASAASSGKCGSSATWKIANKTLTISGSGRMYSYSSDNKAPWYDYNDSFTKVVISSGITNIGAYAFYFCKRMTSISLPSTITALGKCSFCNCGIRSISLPSGIKTIPDFCFDDCIALEKVKIPSSVTSFGQNSFDNSGIVEFTIPNGVTEIPYGMFEDCSQLEKVTIPKSVTKIGSFAFHDCGNLSDIYYKGTYSDFSKISISSSYNDSLNYATIHYQCEPSEHVYTKKTVKATPSNNGYISTECAKCGAVKTKTTIYYPKTIKLSTTSYAYNGKAVKPGVTVKDANGATLSSSNYTISYASGRKNVGKYKITLKFKGQYSGSKDVYFTIKPTTASTISVVLGKTKSIGAKSNQKITYSSSNVKTATVNAKGVITGKKLGKTTVSVKSGTITQKITVSVEKPAVKISGTNSVYIKKSVTLKAVANTGSKVKWSSSNSSIASVSSAGKVTGKKAGTVTIYAKMTYSGKTYTAKYTLTVKNPSLKLNSSTVSMETGKTYKLVATAAPSATVKYMSSNESIATVSTGGVITGVADGNATITAYFVYDGKTYKKTCAVTVKKTSYQTLKSHIIENGSSNESGNKTIGFYDQKNENTYYTTIEYDAVNDCLIFKETCVGSVDVQTSFEFRENQKDISVTMTLAYSTLASAVVDYTLNVHDYYNGAGFTYHITTKGLLNPSDYKSLIGTYNELSFIGWDLLLKTDAGLSLNDIGFVNY